MIKQFDSSYAGHIDLENVGYLGTPVNSRRYGNKQLITAHHKAEAQAQAMDRLGYGALWMAEHHFQPEGTECLPNIILLAVHLTHLTKRLKFHTGFNITPMWHPLRLAEDFAVADILTKGRVVFGVAAVTTHARSKRLALRCWIRRRTANCSRSRSISSSRHSTTSPFRTRVSITRCRPRFLIVATR